MKITYCSYFGICRVPEVHWQLLQAFALGPLVEKAQKSIHELRGPDLLDSSHLLQTHWRNDGVTVVIDVSNGTYTSLEKRRHADRLANAGGLGPWFPSK